MGRFSIFRIAVLFASVLWASSASCEEFRGKWWHYYQRGMEYSDREQLESALGDLKTAIGKREKDQRMARTYGMHFIDYFPHRELGIVYLKKGELDAAIRELEESVRSAESAKGVYYLNAARKARLATMSRGALAPLAISIERGEQPLVTRDASIPVSATVTSGMFVSRVTVNGLNVPVEEAKAKLAFRLALPLDDDTREIRIVAEDLAGNKKEAVVPITVKREGPSVAISALDHVRSGGKSLARLTGEVQDSLGIRAIRIGDHRVETGGARSFPIALDLEAKGAQRVLLRAEDMIGNETVAEIDLSGILREDESQAREEAERERARLALEQEEKRREAERQRALESEKERLAQVALEKLRQEALAVQAAVKLAAQQAEAERLVREEAERVRLAAERGEQERLAREAAERERLARLAAELEEQRLKAEKERALEEQAEKGRLARAAQEKLRREQAAAEAAARLAAQKAEAERRFREAAERERVAQKQRDQEQLARLKAEAEEKVRQAEKAEKERKAKVVVEREKLKAIMNEQKLSKAMSTDSAKQLSSDRMLTGGGPTVFVSPTPVAVAVAVAPVAPARIPAAEKPEKCRKGDRNKPSLDIRDPGVPFVFVDAYPLDGVAVDNCEVERVVVNGRDVSIKKGKEVYFSSIVKLKNGDNSIKVDVYDASGNASSRELHVTRKVPSVLQNGSRMSVLVLPFDHDSASGDSVRLASDYLTGAVAEQKRFMVVERQKLKQLMEERKLSLALGEDNAKAAQLGKIAAAEAIIINSARHNERSLEVTSRIVDTETSEVMSVLDVYTEDVSAASVKNLMTVLAAKIARSFPVVEGIVISRDDDKVVTDLGAPQMVRQRTGAIIYRKGAEIKHPVTGKSLGFETEKLGEGYLDEVQESFSKLKLVQRYRDRVIKPTDLVVTK